MTGGADEARRAAAVEAFADAWDLLDRTDRSEADDARMLAAAFASRHLWERVGGAEQRAVGDWQIAHVASLLGLVEVADRWSASALATAEGEGWTDWRLASMHEGRARACAAAGDADGRSRHVAAARAVLEGVDDPEDREVVESQLATIPEV